MYICVCVYVYIYIYVYIRRDRCGLRGRRAVYSARAVCRSLRDWYFIAEQPAPAPHLARPEGCAVLRIVLVSLS